MPTGKTISIILELSKVKITVAVAFTTITGYVLASRNYIPGFILPTFGIFLLACGSSVINHLQEMRTDAIMKRTRNRPLPSHKISWQMALMLALAETIAGSLALYFSSGLTALLLGLTAMLWYNAIYTNLKRITPHAVIPGSVIGSIPPLVGWVSAGGDLFTAQALIIAIFFFVWQVPHFYLLAVKFGHEYEEAGLPSILHRWSASKIHKNIFFWILLTAAAATVLAMSNLPASFISSVLILVASLMLVISFRNLGFNSHEAYNPFTYFMRINYYVLAVTVFLIGGPLLHYLFHI